MTVQPVHESMGQNHFAVTGKPQSILDPCRATRPIFGRQREPNIRRKPEKGIRNDLPKKIDSGEPSSVLTAYNFLYLIFQRY